jgi:hypothetical protein
MDQKGNVMDLNKYLLENRDENSRDFERMFPLAPRIKCKDGFSLSVQATHGAYCQPRNNYGPWYQVEVGYPSAEPELIMEYAEDPDTPTDTVYGYVPVELVEQLIELHGGQEENP